MYDDVEVSPIEARKEYLRKDAGTWDLWFWVTLGYCIAFFWLLATRRDPGAVLGIGFFFGLALWAMTYSFNSAREASYKLAYLLAEEQRCS